jgi:hypothetical protein
MRARKYDFELVEIDVGEEDFEAVEIRVVHGGEVVFDGAEPVVEDVTRDRSRDSGRTRAIEGSEDDNANEICKKMRWYLINGEEEEGTQTHFLLAVEDGNVGVDRVEDLRENGVGGRLVEVILRSESMEDAEEEVEAILEALLVGEELSDGVQHLLEDVVVACVFEGLDQSGRNLHKGSKAIGTEKMRWSTARLYRTSSFTMVSTMS